MPAGAFAAPGITGNSYYAELNQVRWLGQRNSVYRTQKQTNNAYFWRLGGGTSTVPGYWSSIATLLLTQSPTYGGSLNTTAGLFTSASLLARMHTSIWDGFTSGWNAKFKYLHWRPETALRYGDNSSFVFNTTSTAAYSKPPNWPSELTPVYATPMANATGFPKAPFTPLFNASGINPLNLSYATSVPATDPSGLPLQYHAFWAPEYQEPAHPEYPSTHSVGCEAAAVTLRLFFGSDNITAITGAANISLKTEESYLTFGTGAAPGIRPLVNGSYPSVQKLLFLNASTGLATQYALPTGLSMQTYSTLSQMSRDCSDSRVHGGVHLNMSTNDGMSLGNQVAAFTFTAYPGNLTGFVAAAALLAGAPVL